MQGYLPVGTPKLQVRLRNREGKCFLTIKAGDRLIRLEEEIRITVGQFRTLWPLTKGARIAKRRYLISCLGQTAEMDVYEGHRRGLVTVEVEFDNLRDSHRFKPASWFGREITSDVRFANEALARRRCVPRNLFKPS